MAALSNWTQIANEYKQLADELIETINASDLRIEYKSVVNGNDNSFSNSLSENNVGEINYIDNIFGKIDQSGTITENKVTENIKCRSYWNNKDANFPIPLNNDPDVCKVIIYVADTVKLINASFVYVDGVKCKLVKTPLPYGFGKFYAEAYVKRVDSIIT